ncbi:hypothetical protein NDU88_005096 [Pleurodeles waltl]|uniref:Uncharacterized protein n=1 Tax=Pleurodeles waltl TaxID=8319 RepID=A0AAV7VIV6_PLEWA|nr:hypothetical protein NDU88_005096 [Pleurodeles waltl]
MVQPGLALCTPEICGTEHWDRRRGDRPDSRRGSPPDQRGVHEPHQSGERAVHWDRRRGERPRQEGGGRSQTSGQSTNHIGAREGEPLEHRCDRTETCNGSSGWR